MNEQPLKLQQLIITTAAELGLGEVDKSSLELALVRAYNMGLKDGQSRTISDV